MPAVTRKCYNRHFLWQHSGWVWGNILCQSVAGYGLLCGWLYLGIRGSIGRFDEADVEDHNGNDQN